MMDLRAEFDGGAEAMVVEARVDRGLGALANVIVDRGTLRVGDVCVCGVHSGRVRLLLDSTGAEVREAGPSTPVSIVGLDGAPEAGADLLVVDSLETAARVCEYRREKARKAASMRDLMATRKASVSKAAAAAAAAAAEAAAASVAEGGAAAAAEAAAAKLVAAAQSSDKVDGKGDKEIAPEAVAEAASDAFIDHAVAEMKAKAAKQAILDAAAAAATAAAAGYQKLSWNERRTASRDRKFDRLKATEAERVEALAAVKKPEAVLIVKADNHGSLKTLLDFVDMMPRDEVDIRVCSTGIGEIAESDVQHAASFGATIFGFNVEASQVQYQCAAAGR
jgi:translation initiation factor IF-2